MAIKKSLIILSALVVIAGLCFNLIPNSVDDAQRLQHARVAAPRVAKAHAPSESTRSIEVSPTNATIGFSCAKTIAGKTLNVRGGWNGAFGSKITGTIELGPEYGHITKVDLQIDVDSLWSEHDLLTDALLTKGFFQPSKHPQAIFISTDIRPTKSSSDENNAYDLEGNLCLNGIEKSIAIQIRIDGNGEDAVLKSEFSLHRSDFNVRYSEAGGFGLLSDEDISDLVAVDVSVRLSTPDIDSTRDKPADEKASVGQLSGRKSFEESSLPRAYREAIPATLVEFDMALVPGDSSKSAPPIYMGTHEVTWDEFMPWVDGRDLESLGEIGELRAIKLRPSPPYGSVDRGFGMGRRPALGMSRLAAEKYCEWLSKETGRKYRLPTEKEWKRAFVMGGGVLDQPPTADQANLTAVYFENSWDDQIDDWATKPVGSLAPNALGIYDLAGNVCEWVVGAGDDHVALGGHFDADLDELGVGRAVEDEAWNRDYPNEPKSLWWFVNARWVGFRLVSDVESR